MKYSADAECEIIHCVNCEISHFVRCEMKFALHICEANISQRSYFTWALPNFTRRRRISLKKAHLRCRCAFFWRCRSDLNRWITVLQTGALPLGYVTTWSGLRGSAYASALPLLLSRHIASPNWSGLRGSNPPPRPWQGRALPNELNPHRWIFSFLFLPKVKIVATRRGLEPLTSSVTG